MKKTIGLPAVLSIALAIVDAQDAQLVVGARIAGIQCQRAFDVGDGCGKVAQHLVRARSKHQRLSPVCLSQCRRREHGVGELPRAPGIPGGYEFHGQTV